MDFLYFKSNINATRFMSNVTTLPNDLEVGAANIGPEMALVCPGLHSWLIRSGDSDDFASSEAAWQALKALNYETFLRFTTKGDLGKLSLAFFQRLYPKNPDKALKKFNSWTRKLADGIVAKIAANPKHAKKLGLRPGVDMNYEREHLSPTTENKVWMTLLGLKYRQNPSLKDRLLLTGSKILVELEPGAKKGHAHWGGLVVDNAVVGENKMGQYMMKIRETVM